MSPAASGLAAPVSEATVRAHVGGDVSGQVAVGDHINQVGSVHGDLVLQQQRRPTVEPRSRPLHRPPSPFPNLLGRDPEVTSAIGRLRDARGTGFHGASGVGKSSLLRHLANHPGAAAMPDGILHCPGRGQPLGDLLQLIFDGFYDAEMGYTPTPGQVRHYLGSLTALVVIDDLDLDDKDVGVLADTLAGCTFVLASHRRCMWEPGRSVAVRGLPEPAARSLLERELDRPLSPSEDDAARALWRALDGHPRCLVQAAAVVVDQGRSLAEVAEAVATSAGPPEETVGSQALAGLTVAEGDVLALVAAVAPAPIHVDRVAAITGSSDSRMPLEALRARGLITAHSPRYSLTVSLPPEDRTRRDRWAATAIDHYAATLEAGRRRPEQFGDDVDAIRALVRWAGREKRWRDVVRLVQGADPVLGVCRRWEARDELVRHALVAARSTGDQAAEAWCHHQLGTRALWMGDADVARHELTRALELRQSLGDIRGAEVTQFHLDQLGGPPPPDQPVLDPAPGPSGSGRPRASTLAVLCLLAVVGAALLVIRSPGTQEPTALVPIGSTRVQVDPSALSFQVTRVGITSSPKTVTLTNVGELPFTGRATVVGGDDFTVVDDGCNGPVAAGGSCKVVLAFTPSVTGDRRAALFVDTGEGRVEVPLRGSGSAADPRPNSSSTAPAEPSSTSVADQTTTVPTPVAAGLQPDRTTVTFGDVLVGTSSPESRVVVRNPGSGPVKVTAITVAGAQGSEFKFSDRCRSAPLAAASTCDISIWFSPGAVGGRVASMTIVAESGPPVTVALTGTGTGPVLRLEPPAMMFDKQEAGTTGEQRFTVRNTGTAVASILTASMNSCCAFVAESDCAQVKPGASCTIDVAFTPGKPGSFSGTLTVTPDIGPVLTATVTGTAVAATTTTVEFKAVPVYVAPS